MALNTFKCNYANVTSGTCRSAPVCDWHTQSWSNGRDYGWSTGRHVVILVRITSYALHWLFRPRSWLSLLYDASRRINYRCLFTLMGHSCTSSVVSCIVLSPAYISPVISGLSQHCDLHVPLSDTFPIFPCLLWKIPRSSPHSLWAVSDYISAGTDN